MAKSSSFTSDVANVYAGSLYELAAETKKVAAIEEELGRVEQLIEGSKDLQRLIGSPVFSADEQSRAVSAIAGKAKFAPLVANFLSVVARNRRLFAVPGMIRAFRRIAAEQRGEIAAEVTSAHELSADQKKELTAALKGVAGKDVSIRVAVDPALLGGLVVKMGSQQIDTSLKTKLNSLKLALKEVG